MEIQRKPVSNTQLTLASLTPGDVFTFEFENHQDVYVRTDLPITQPGNHIRLKNGQACYNGGSFVVRLVRGKFVEE